MLARSEAGDFRVIVPIELSGRGKPDACPSNSLNSES
jgi:hypothetical protein